MESVYEYVSVNLKFKKKNELAFPFLDFGFLYGYGLFESIKVKNGIPLLLEYHFSRLKRGSIILDIPFDHTITELTSHIQKLILKNKLESAILNIYLTPGNRSHDPSIVTIEEPFLLMVTRVWPDYQLNYGVSLELRQESFKKTPLDRFKTLSWVKNILEKRLSTLSDDVLLYDENGFILETSRANVYFVKDKTIYTPKSSVILPGVIRQFLLDKQDEIGYEFKETQIDIHHLSEFDEMFLSNALRGIFFVKELLRFDGLESKGVAKDVRESFCKVMEHSVVNV